MGELKIAGGSARVPIIQQIIEESIGETGADRGQMLPDGVTAGDTRLMWNKGNTDEVEASKATFDKLKKKGFKAYRINKDDPAKKGTEVVKFDSEAEAIWMVPPMSGGGAPPDDREERTTLSKRILNMAEEMAPNEILAALSDYDKMVLAKVEIDRLYMQAAMARAEAQA